MLTKGNDVSAHREIPRQGERKERQLVSTEVGLSWNKKHEGGRDVALISTVTPEC